jgi:hypothetical protein
VYLGDEEYAELVHLALEKGIRVTLLVRQIIRQHLKGVKT